MSFLLFKEIRRVFQAELLRHLRVAPGSTLMATLVFPFVTILALNTLPRVQSAGLFQLQRAVWSLETFELPASETHDDHAVPTPLPPPLAPVLGLKPPPPLPPLLTAEDAARPWLDALSQQPFYKLERVSDARAPFERQEVGLALLIKVGVEQAQPRTLELEVLRRHDFFSSLFMDQVRKVEQQLLSAERQRLPGALVSAESQEEQVAREGRSGLTQVAPFLLLGFAWFFLTVGATDAFVVERERRTLETLLSAPLSRLGLAWGKVLFVVFQTALPQLSGALAFVVLGFSPWVLSVVALLIALLVPAGVLIFWYYRDLDNSMAVGWRNGLMFMLGFPLLILTDDVIGTLSPLYHLSKALEGPPPAAFFGAWLGVAAALIGLSTLWMPRLARRWVA